MPALSLAEQVIFTKRFARADATYLSTASVDAATNAYSDDITRRYIYAGVEEFVKKAGGPTKQNFITVTPKFWARTNWYIQLTITDSVGGNGLAATNVSVATEDYDGIGGATAASHLSSNINAAIGAGTMTVTWSDLTWTFTITEQSASNVTAIAVDSPSENTNYIDATDELFGKTGTETGASWTSSFPEDCTLESNLPTGFLAMEYVEYDNHPLYPAPFEIFMSPETASTWPDHYAIRDKKIYIAPSVRDRRKLKIRYKYLPTQGTLTGSSDATISCGLSDENHMAPVYYAAGMILRETFEPEESDRMFQLFYDQVTEYRRKEANQNPKMFPRNLKYYVPDVNVDEV